MAYTVKQLAKLAQVSVRTLHHYDAIGLLKPARVEANGYRQYGEAELLKLQQILFFRELDFPLGEIKRILNAPDFDMKAALADQKEMLALKRKRLTGLLKTIDQTLLKLNQKITMNDQDLYSSFDSGEMNKYAEEAKQRWGHTEAYRQSQERTKKYTKEDWARIAKENDDLMKEIVAVSDHNPASPEVQKLMSRHYDGLRRFYEPALEMYRGRSRRCACCTFPPNTGSPGRADELPGRVPSGRREERQSSRGR
jgi:DNA-binding transcriptional MerR regulator